MSGVPFDSSNFKVGLDTRDLENKPYAIVVPTDWQVPVEAIDIGEAYPDFASFVTSGGSTNTNWYQKADQKKVVGWRIQDVAQ